MDISSEFERRLQRLESIVFYNDDSFEERKNEKIVDQSYKITYEKPVLLSLRDELLRLNHLKRPSCLQDYKPRKIKLASSPTSSRIVTIVPMESESPSHHNKKISSSHNIYNDNEGPRGPAMTLQPPPPLSQIEEKSSKDKVKKNDFITRDEGKVEVQYGLIVRSPDN
jgi:hypothetical protein